VPVLGVCVAVGLLAAAVGSLTAFSAVSTPSGHKGAVAVKPAATPKATIITVALGKPSELKFKLSKTSMIPAGPITFKVTNPGAGFHNFKICAKPIASASAAKNACTGKATAILKHGGSATLTLTLSKAGKYEFLCSVTGHAAAGMKGLIGVGVVVTLAEQKTAATAGSTSTGGTGGGGTGGGGTGGGGTGGGGTPTGEQSGPAIGCPVGVTVRASGNTDGDGDELATEPDDQDGCV
jgi:uncharacterized cupredoxin-like copper-binding protein